MEHVGDLLGRYNAKQPDETVALKRYIADTFDSPCSIAIKGETIIITVLSASLANTLRLQTSDLQKIAQTSKRLVFRIG